MTEDGKELRIALWNPEGIPRTQSRKFFEFLGVDCGLMILREDRTKNSEQRIQNTEYRRQKRENGKKVAKFVDLR
jgi:hypothetical protein